MQTIETKRSALAALRKLGYKKSVMQMTRGAITYSKSGELGARLMVTLSDHAFIITDTRGDWGFSSMLLNIGNTKAGASEHLQTKVEEMIDLGVLEEGEQINHFQLAVALVTACHKSEN